MIGLINLTPTWRPNTPKPAIRRRKPRRKVVKKVTKTRVIKTPTQAQRNDKIARSISRRVGVICILCDEVLYVDWGETESKQPGVVADHIDSKHSAEVKNKGSAVYTRIASSMTRRMGTVCILCEEGIYSSWKPAKELNTDAIIQHFDTEHESEAAIVALTQDINTIGDIITKAKSDKANKAFTNVTAFRVKRARVFHLPSLWGGSGSRCGTVYNSYYARNIKEEKKKWGKVPYKDRCKTCIRSSVKGQR